MNLQDNQNTEEISNYNITFVSQQMKKLKHARIVMASGSMVAAFLGFASLFNGQAMAPFTYGFSLTSVIALLEY